MKRTFVLRLSSESDPNRGDFAGRVEHVATNREERFATIDELLAFIASCLEAERSVP